MASLGDLVVNLTTNTKGFGKGLSKGRSMLGSFVGSVGKGLKTVGKFGAAVGAAGAAAGAAAGGGLALLARQQMGVIDNTAKMAKSLGTTTQDLVGLRFAAEQTGTSAKLMNDSIDRFTRRIGKAAQGTGPAKKGLEELGLSAQELAKQNPADAMGVIADRLQGVESQAKKAGLAQQFFGAQGARLLPLLDQGSEGMRKFKARAEELGLSFTEEEAAKVEKANDAINRMKKLFVGIGRDIAIAVAPTITSMANKVRELWPTVQQIFGNIKAHITSRIQAIWPTVQTIFGNIKSFIMTVWTNLGPVFVQYRNTVITGLQFVWNIASSVFTRLFSLAQSIFPGIGTTAGSTFGKITSFVQDAMIVAEFAMKNWRAVAKLAFDKALLAGVTFFNQVKFFFTDVIPGFFTWFTNNWRDVFFTAFDLATTVFINLGKNIRNTMREIWDFIKSGGTDAMELSWTPLTKGFKSSISELPDIGKREMGALEKQLSDSVSKQEKQLGGKLGEFMNKRKKQTEKELSGLFDFGKGPKTDLEVKPSKDLKNTVADTKPEQGQQQSEQPQFAKALEAGTADAFSAILKATTGRRDPEKKTEEHTKKIAENQKKLNSTMKKVEKNTRNQRIKKAEF